MYIYKILFIFGILLIILLLQHIIHEHSHILAARLLGVRVSKVRWFAYPKLLLGTRVFYEDEPDLDEKNIEKKWGWIAAAGFMGTTAVGYIVTVIGFLFQRCMVNGLILTVCFFSMIFLTSDPLYFALGSIFGYGDIIGFRKVFQISKSVSVLLSLLVLLSNILLIKLVWYGL